jgi:carbon dioxide concentrating mechanism protein CcmN
MSSNESSLQAIVLANAVGTLEIEPSYRYGDVSIDPSAIIAPGVLLQAEADSRIIIGAGVCIGLESIIHATGGTIEIDRGTCLGMGVLVVGAGRIGKYVCIGSGTTTIDPQIEQGAVIPPHSLLGDRSRTINHVTIDTEPIPEPWDSAPMAEPLPEPWDSAPTVEPLPEPWDTPTPTPPVNILSSPPPEPPNPPEYVSIESEGSAGSSADSPDRPMAETKSVAGREHFNRLRRKLFPDIPT